MRWFHWQYLGSTLQNQILLNNTKDCVEFTLSIRTHFTTESPKPDIAPYRPATVLVMQ